MSRHTMLRAGLLVCALVLAACGGKVATSSGAQSSPSTSAGGSASAAAARVPAPAADWPEFGDNAQATGVGPAHTGITPATLGRLRLRTVRIDGVADSTAIELHGVRVHGSRRDLVAVTTSYGKTIAIDARTGRRLWEFDPAGVNSTPGNPQVTTASPAADPDRRFIYSASPNGVIHKLSVATGHQVWSQRILFDPVHEKIASSLTISGRWVVAVTGGYYGDAPPYDGHVVTIDRASGRIDHVWNTECSSRHALIRASSCPATRNRGDNAIWGRPGAVIEPGSGRILVATGNGPFDGRTTWGDSVLELSADAGRLLQNWTPANQVSLYHSDTDLGSSSPVQLPPFHGARLIIQGGKDGLLHLLNLARLNGAVAAAGPRLGGQVSQVSAPGGGEVVAQPAVWTHGGQVYVFATTSSGTAAYRLVDPRHPRLAPVWSDGTAGTSPVVAGGLLYVYDPGGGIDIRRPLTGALLRRLPAGSGHWNSPIVAGGRIIETTGNYHSSATASTIDIYHLPGR